MRLYTSCLFLLVRKLLLVVVLTLSSPSARRELLLYYRSHACIPSTIVVTRHSCDTHKNPLTVAPVLVTVLSLSPLPPSLPLSLPLSLTHRFGLGKVHGGLVTRLQEMENLPPPLEQEGVGDNETTFTEPTTAEIATYVQLTDWSHRYPATVPV